MKTLYICYFGLREPLVQTQVLPYLRRLAGAGIDVSLLTFEPQSGERRGARESDEEERARLAGEGVRWHRRTYHKRLRGPATAYDVLAGALAAARLARRQRIDVLHARSHVPMAMAMLAAPLTGCRLVFDIRGLWAEEYVDIGNWAEGSAPFRLVKKVERAGVRRADQVVVLTRRMRDWLVGLGLAGGEKIEVIPCCVEPSRFEDPESAASEPEARAFGSDAGASESGGRRFEVIYVGTVVGLHLLEEMGQFFLRLRARCPGVFLRVLTDTPAAEVEAVLVRVGVRPEDLWAGRADPAEVPAYLRGARLGLSFRKPTFAQIAASPAKIPEYLAAGLPVVCNAGVGDMDELLAGENVGVLLKAFDEEAYDVAAGRALALTAEPETRARCRRVARQYFDLNDVGGAGYLNVYRRLQRRSLERD
jgi:glycosyltransferase involved in cell wall biosynthesis